MKYLDLFTGIGGFTKAIQNAANNNNSAKRKEHGRRKQNLPDDRSEQMGDEQPTCIGFSEIDKHASAIYQKHFPTHNPIGDVTKISTATLPDFDILVGGFPCQAFSVAGKRRGFNDTRGTLFFEIARILRDKKPRYFLLENVKGLLSHDSGRTFSTIIETLQEIGYGVSWKVLNTRDFGIPQNRERVFIFGTRGKPAREILPASGAFQETAKWKSGDKIAKAVLTPGRLEKRQNGRRFKEDGEPSFTINCQDVHGVSDDKKIRRLTPLECERLQGFPDDWTKYGLILPSKKELAKWAANNPREEITPEYIEQAISDTQRYKCCGNAVTMKVVEKIMDQIISQSNESDFEDLESVSAPLGESKGIREDTK